MTLSEKVKLKPSGSDSYSESYVNEMFLVLYNDDVNSFEFVIETLIEVCGHQPEQAEQCALITHTKGKCDIKKGPFSTLKPIKEILILRGLSAVIE
jgi:ATP-dependent Clp protease adaptor protein ClpS